MGKAGSCWSGGRGTWGLLTIVVVASLGVVGCGGGSGNGASSKTGSRGASIFTGWPSQGTPKNGGTAIVDVAEGGLDLNPITTGFTPANMGPEVALFDQLIELMPDPTGGEAESKLEPGLAESWSISPDNKTYTFHLRPGVKFSNGEPLTAEDVVFSLRGESASTGSGYTFSRNWQSIAAAGPMTVTLTLKKPEPATIETLNIPQFSIVPKHAYEKEGATKFGLHPIGTGAFVIKSSTPGFTNIALARNPSYWRHGEPHLDNLIFNSVESDNARILAVRSGGATVAQQIPYAQVPTLKTTAGVKMLVGPEWGASFVVFNRTIKPFNDVNVRKALMYATPREEIIKSVYKGLGTGANSLWGRLKYWDPSVPAYPYDLAKAREFLAKSSVPHGFHMTLSTIGGETQGQLLAAILQNSYAQIGIDASIHPVQSAALYENFGTGKFESTVFPPEAGWSQFYEPNGDAAYYLNQHEAVGFEPTASPSTLEKLDEASTSTDAAKRAQLWGELQRQTLWQEATFVPIVDLVSLNLASDKLRGFQVLPSLNVRWERLWLEE